MEIYILGIDHEIQLADSSKTKAEKGEFAKLLLKIFSQRQIDFIGEETFPEKATIARVFGGVEGIRWQHIEMSTSARNELEIADEQASQRHVPIFRENLVVGSRPKRLLSDYIREEYMVWRTLTTAEENTNILILCGLMHVEYLRKLFEREGHQVTVDSLCNYAWYSRSTECAEAVTANLEH